MQATVKTDEIQVSLHLSDERRSLANFLSILDKNKIESLEISDLKDDKIPRNIQRFSNLKSIRFVRCHELTTLPSELSSCSNLRELAFVKCADFYDLRGIGDLQNLEILQVSGCESFEEFPDELADMPLLKVMDFSYSDGIRWLPASCLPRSLKLLDMHGCWQADFSDNEISPLPLVSIQIQDLSRLEDMNTAPVVPDLCRQLRHTMTLRNGCGLDE